MRAGTVRSLHLMSELLSRGRPDLRGSSPVRSHSSSILVALPTLILFQPMTLTSEIGGGFVEDGVVNCTPNYGRSTTDIFHWQGGSRNSALSLEFDMSDMDFWLFDRVFPRNSVSNQQFRIQNLEVELMSDIIQAAQICTNLRPPSCSTAYRGS